MTPKSSTHGTHCTLYHGVLSHYTRSFKRERRAESRGGQERCILTLKCCFEQTDDKDEGILRCASIGRGPNPPVCISIFFSFSMYFFSSSLRCHFYFCQIYRLVRPTAKHNDLRSNLLRRPLTTWHLRILGPSKSLQYFFHALLTNLPKRVLSRRSTICASLLIL